MKIRMTIELEDTIYQKVRACRTRYRCWASKCTKPTRTNLLFDCQYPIKQKPRCVCRGFFLLNMSQILTAQCAPRNLKNVYTTRSFNIHKSAHGKLVISRGLGVDYIALELYNLAIELYSCTAK